MARAERRGEEPTREGGATFSPAAKLDSLSPRQKEEVESQSRPNAALIHETIRAEGESELERAAWAIVLSGLAAGLSMGFSLVVEGELHAIIPAGPARHLLANLGYTIGFLIVVLGRQQLFTENTLTPILPLLHNRDADTLWRVLRLWVLVLAANLVGTWIFAAVIAHTEVFDAQTLHAFAEISRRGIEASFGITLLRAIFAGWLIALMVWLLPAAETSRPLIIIIVTYVVALGGFAHVIAGSVDTAFLVHTGEASLQDYVLRFFVPTLVGNIIGGVALVAALTTGRSRRKLRATNKPADAALSVTRARRRSGRRKERGALQQALRVLLSWTAPRVSNAVTPLPLAG
jgi:formate/nitrite transporter FocA (FNT family)